MKIFPSIKIIAPIVAFSLSVVSCKKLLDVSPKDVLDEKHVYLTVSDADAAVIGVYGKFMNLAAPYVVLNELRADLMTTTTNADENLRQLNEHEVAEGNPYANPRPFYEVILNCNDILYNLNVMYAEKKLKDEEFNMRYSDITALRTWVYLQLGIQFGNVPYITDPMASTSAATIANMPKMEFTALLAELVKTMEAIPYKQPYAATSSIVASPVDGYAIGKFFVNKQVLLAQLYLWTGQYNKSAILYKGVMETGGTGDYQTYRLPYSSKGDNNDIAVGYYRYRELDESQLVDANGFGWRSIFARTPDRLFNNEWVWYMPFNSAFSPENPFIKLFSNRGGSYLLKPSQSAMDNWNSQVQKNNFPYDARGKKFTYRNLDGKDVIMKYLYNFLDESTFLPTNVFAKNGKWFLYRAAAMHLEYAEAANRDNHSYIAYAVLNQGFTTLPNKITTEGVPYNFDSRKSDVPAITADWYQSAGVRGRAYVNSVEITGDSTLAIENAIVNEGALELAYEGKRWQDLVRVALRRNDPAFLADKVYNKLLKDNNPKAAAVRAKLMNKANWFLPFKWQ